MDINVVRTPSINISLKPNVYSTIYYLKMSLLIITNWTAVTVHWSEAQKWLHLHTLHFV